jgi:NTP pyrophosphatase (non-canonical NTP hydrolase)
MTDPEFVQDIETCNHFNEDSSVKDQVYTAMLVAEELNELGQALIKLYIREKPSAADKVHEETVDVLLMIDQLIRMSDESLLRKWMKIKLDRTIERYHTNPESYDDKAQY